MGAGIEQHCLKPFIMNKEMQYIGQGILLVFVVLAGLKTVQVLGDIEQRNESKVYTAAGIPTVIGPALRDDQQRGRTLFESNCATCHKVDKDLTGPALKGIEDRVKDKKLLYAWIRNNNAVLKTGNAYFVKLYKDWNQTPMNTFINLTDEQIGQILAYIREHRVGVVSNIVACR